MCCPGAILHMLSFFPRPFPRPFPCPRPPSPALTRPSPALARPSSGPHPAFPRPFPVLSPPSSGPHPALIRPSSGPHPALIPPPVFRQHPDHDVSLGQKLMKDVYEALRASPHWEETLLIITYDEHGGFYDHFSVPVDVPNPDGLVSPEFDFTRLGPRVPALFISPWIDAGTLVHRPSGPFPGSSQFEHASVAATMKLLFNLTSFLNARDAWAGTFEGVFSPTRTTPRQDCPVTLPEPKPLANFVPPTGREPLSGLQRDLVALAAGLHGIEAVDTSNMTVTEGLRLVQRLVNRHFKRNMYPAHLLAADEVGPAEF